MSIPKGQAAILVVGGALVGAGVTTLVLKKHYENLASEEIAEIKEYYRNRDVEYASKEKDLKKHNLDLLDIVTEVSEKGNPQFSKEDRDFNDRLIDESEYSTQSDYTDEEVEALKDVARDLDSNPNISDREIMAEERDPDIPYLITLDDYNESDLDPVSVTYYEKDNTLVDEREKLVDDVESTVGSQHLRMFGHGSEDEDIVYVRNERLAVDFEITRDYRSYWTDVLGAEQMERKLIREPKPRPRKMRRD